MPSAFTISMKRSKLRELSVFSANEVMPLSVTSWALATAHEADSNQRCQSSGQPVVHDVLPARARILAMETPDPDARRARRRAGPQYGSRRIPLEDPFSRGRRNATDLDGRPMTGATHAVGRLSPMAFLVAVMLGACMPVTPTRCVQRLGRRVETCAPAAIAVKPRTHRPPLLRGASRGGSALAACYLALPAQACALGIVERLETGAGRDLLAGDLDGVGRSASSSSALSPGLQAT